MFFTPLEQNINTYTVYLTKSLPNIPAQLIIPKKLYYLYHWFKFKDLHYIICLTILYHCSVYRFNFPLDIQILSINFTQSI